MVGNFFGAAEKRVIPGAESQFEVGSFMSATLSCDHRVIDGTSFFFSCVSYKQWMMLVIPIYGKVCALTIHYSVSQAPSVRNG
jgi:NRPS condensation-like uncharacterized protein